MVMYNNVDNNLQNVILCTDEVMFSPWSNQYRLEIDSILKLMGKKGVVCLKYHFSWLLLIRYSSVTK